MTGITEDLTRESQLNVGQGGVADKMQLRPLTFLVWLIHMRTQQYGFDHARISISLFKP